MKLYQTTIALVLAGMFSAPPASANKPLHGKYLCKGTATQAINIGGVGGGNRSSKVKGRLLASRGSFTVFVTTQGWQSVIAGYLEPDMQKVSWSSSNKSSKGMLRGCYVGTMWQTGSGFQNKKGRSVTLSLEQAYYCGSSDAENVDTYRLTCKR